MMMMINKSINKQINKLITNAFLIDICIGPTKLLRLFSFEKLSFTKHHLLTCSIYSFLQNANVYHD